MAKIFSNPQSADQLTQLMARAEGDPIIAKGMQAAFMRWFKSPQGVMGATESASVDRLLRSTVETLNKDGVKNAFEYAEIVFKNEPEFVEALDILLSEAAGVARSRGATAIPTGSGTAELAEQVAAVNRGITATVGVLSRMGARVRTTAVGAIQRAFAKDTYYNMLDNLMSNPDEFIRGIKDVVREDKAVGTIPIRLPFTKGKQIPDAVPFLGGKEVVYYLDRGALYKALVRAGVYREGNEEDQRSFMEQLAQTELDFTKARDEFIESQELGLERTNN